MYMANICGLVSGMGINWNIIQVPVGQVVSLLLPVYVPLESLVLGPVGNDPLQTSDIRAMPLQTFHYLLIYPTERKAGRWKVELGGQVGKRTEEKGRRG